jgi:hypothetical protein
MISFKCNIFVAEVPEQLATTDRSKHEATSYSVDVWVIGLAFLFMYYLELAICIGIGAIPI